MIIDSKLIINVDQAGFITLSIGENNVKMKSVGAQHLIGELTKAIKDLQDLNEMERRKVSLLKDYNGEGKVINFLDVASK